MPSMPIRDRKDPVPLQHILGESSLASIVHKARLLEQLRAALHGSLPPALANASGVLNLRDNVLMVACASSAIAMRLRFMEEDILRQIGPVSPVPIVHINCVVRQDLSY